MKGGGGGLGWMKEGIRGRICFLDHVAVLQTQLQ